MTTVTRGAPRDPGHASAPARACEHKAGAGCMIAMQACELVGRGHRPPRLSRGDAMDSLWLFLRKFEL